MPGNGLATVRATSVADPSRSASSVVTLVDPGTGAGSRDAALREAYTGTRTTASLSLNGVETVAQAVFEASGQNSGQLTTTGTLTQTGAETFTWSNTPTDRLVVAFGDESRLEFVIEAFTGDFSSGWEGFRDFHSSLVFTTVTEGSFSLRIQSQSGAPQAPEAAALSPTGTTRFSRTVEGTLQFAGVPVQVAVINTGEVSADFSGGNVDYRSAETTTGTLTSANASITVNEGYEYVFVSVTSAVEQSKRANLSSAQVGGNTYAFRDVWAQTTCRNNLVTETEFWQARGELLQNGTAIGVIQFESTPAAGTECPGPQPVVRMNDGSVVPL